MSPFSTGRTGSSSGQMHLLALVRRAVREHHLARPDTMVVVALSGGSDSVALAHLIEALAAAGDLRPAGVAHFNHQLRATADRDEQVCRELAHGLGWPIVTGREDVAARARRERRSIEVAARAARYEFFERARAELGGDVVATGHTRDDQAETFLLRLLRGAGSRGLAAMAPRAGSIIRPLLDCRRSALRAYLDERRIAYIEDESNWDVAVPRNRVRAELLPLLEERFNPKIVRVLAEQAALAREEWTWMAAVVDELSGRLCHSLPGSRPACEIELPGLLAAPPALRRLLLWRAMTGIAGGRQVGFEHVQAALRLLDEPASSGIDAPGQRVQRIGSHLVLTGRVPGAVGRPMPAPLNFRYPLSIPGKVRLEEAGCIVSAETRPLGVGTEGSLAATGGGIAVLSSDLCRAPLTVRNRRPGDRFRPLGLGGRKKLQDFFVDRKVERRRRDMVPLVVDDRDRIVWVAGYAIDDEFRVTDATRAVLILRMMPLGDPA